MKIDSIALNYARLRRRLPDFQVYVGTFVDGDRRVRAVGAAWKDEFGPIASVVPIEGDPMACLRFLLANLVVETRTGVVNDIVRRAQTGGKWLELGGASGRQFVA